MKRAYSLLEIKAVHEDERIIEGIATTPTTDRMDDIVEPEGAEFKLPLPLLYQHDSDSPIGHVIEADVKEDGIHIKAKIESEDEPGPVKDILDKAWGFIKKKLIRGLSIGFRSLETADIEGSFGRRFIRWEWLELSAVTIPANSEATIQVVRSIDSKALAASGKGAAEKTTPGVSGVKIGKHMNIQEQIKGFEEARKEKAARMSELMEDSAAEGETLDAEQTEEYDTLDAEISQIDKHIKRLKALEKVNQSQAEPVKPNPDPPGAEKGTVSAGPVAKKPLLKDGLAMGQLAKFIGRAKGSEDRALRMAMNDNRTDPRVVNVLKAAVEAGTTDSSAWAGALVGDETTVFADFVEYLRPQTIVGRFGTNGIPALRNVPFRTALIGQTSGGAGYWVGEGKAKPLTKFAFERKTLEPLKVANIAVVTEEVLRSSSPAADGIIRDQLVAALRERLDEDFIDPAKAAVSGVSPASITNGISATASSGVTADDVRLDIRAAFAGFIAANNAPTNGVWIMSATTALSLSLMHNALGNREFPDVNMTGGTLWGLPVIVSEHVTSDSTGHFVILINASDIYLGDEGGFMVDLSREASLEMDDDPSHNSNSPSESTLVSLWQTNSVGFRAEREINWMRRRDNAVQVLSGVNWGDEEASA